MTPAKRPTETITGVGAALAVYGFCTQVGLPELAAAIVAVVVLVVPFLISEIVDALRVPPASARHELPPKPAASDEGVAVLEGGDGGGRRHDGS